MTDTNAEIAATSAHATAQALYARKLESEWRAVAEAFERVANYVSQREAHERETQA